MDILTLGTAVRKGLGIVREGLGKGNRGLWKGKRRQKKQKNNRIPPKIKKHPKTGNIAAKHSSRKRPLTRNLRFCFQWLPWAFVAIWASVTTRISSHSSCVGSGRSHTVFCSSSRRRRSRFSSISFRLARRLLSSNTTGKTMACLQELRTTSICLFIYQSNTRSTFGKGFNCTIIN